MPKPIEWYLFVGDGFGAGLRHQVVSITGDGMVTTWSEPSPDETMGGESWLGPIAAFKQQFRRTE